MTDTERTALVIGATGSFGGHAAAALVRHGWTVRALARDPQAARAKAGPRMPIDWIAGDAMNAEDVTRAAAGTSVIVHAANPPGYRKWRGLVLPMLAATIAAAEASGARIVLPGAVYNYAPDSGARIAETAPQAPTTRKGRIRVAMERMLREATQRGIRTLVLRAGDFFGPAAPNSCLQWLTTRRGGRVRSVLAPGPVDVGHAFAYLPDLAETLARLLDREAELEDFETFHVAGHWLARGDDLVGAIRRAAGDPAIPLKPFPYPLIYALSPFSETFRELLEMRYLWEKPIGLDDAKLRAFLGEVPTTPFDTGVRETLADMGCSNPGTSRPALFKGWAGSLRSSRLDAAHVRQDPL
ncbi:MAG: NAD-dependent epimerase/dehydratase [Caulobacteraceae bacterium]|nr:NAD-dependent epimerase/dehydratase [Caulobacteraceae bacterium]